jgi:hypothetical protein
VAGFINASLEYNLHNSYGMYNDHFLLIIYQYNPCRMK